ncbi:MAG: serine/threonine-protein phosphatase [Thauera phenolivorans]|uniref:Serine/threonine-protein phosphatase n=1 Tax=Thauera phenolivorans TaxID=1792543 RepID=A0A7X7LUB1_9RHOO|nr:protein phosphatase 2C domain-containing protein [Thauera phenolivorans]NLF53569.1 serine/threonine-protein phosphatase [Thauera phenolivorans]
MAIASRTDCGRVRSRNEDALGLDAARGWAVLADGVGGHPGGDVAARVVVDAVLARLAADAADADDPALAEQALRRAVHDAHLGLLREGRRMPLLAGMGSTVVAAIFLSHQVVCAHVGDSRLYRFSDGRLARLTRDHSLLQERLDAGLDVAEGGPLAGMLTRGLGAGLAVVPELGRHPVLPGDRFLLCSDGLTDMVSDAEIGQVLATAPTAEVAADRLLGLALDHGGADNVSLILVEAPAVHNDD